MRLVAWTKHGTPLDQALRVPTRPVASAHAILNARFAVGSRGHGRRLALTPSRASTGFSSRVDGARSATALRNVVPTFSREAASSLV